VAKQINHRLFLTSQFVLVATGVVLLGYRAIVVARAKIYQISQLRRVERIPSAETSTEAHHQSHASAGSTQAGPIEGTALARLTVPDLKMDLIVVEGVSPQDLSVAPGHIPGTSLPGQAGNVGIAGHRDTVFRPLRSVRRNQIITLSTGKEEVHYRVVSFEVVSPSEVGVLYPTNHDTLTLVTCYPFNFLGSAPNRFIVHADRVTTRHSRGERPDH
jgi:LPXTG-site transpeptidase (sortase) family protein